MITAFTIKNFKAIGDEPVRIELKPITLLFGANSAGKSSILHALNYAYSVFVDHNLNAEYNAHSDSSFNLESFDRFVHKEKDKDNNNILIRFDINFKKEQYDCNDTLSSYSDERFFYYDGQYGEYAYNIFNSINQSKIDLKTAYVELEISWDRIKNCPYVLRYETGFDEESLATIYADGCDNKVAVRFINKEHKLYKGLIDNEFNIGWLSNLNHEIPLSQKDALPNFKQGLCPKKNTWCDSKDLVTRGFFKENEISYNFEVDFLRRNMSDFENFIAATLILPGRRVTEWLKSTIYLGPLREIPSRHFLGDEVSGDNSERRWRWEKGLGAWDILYRIGQLQLDQSKKPIEDISVWIKENFEEHYDEILSVISGHPDHQVKFEEYDNNAGPFFEDRSSYKEIDDFLDHCKKENLKKYISNLPIDTLISLDLPRKSSKEFADRLRDKINYWLASDQCLNTGYEVFIEKFRKISSGFFENFDKDRSQEELLKEILNKPETTQTWLRDISRGIDLKPHEIGTGISQVLPVVVAAVAMNTSLLTIEQPELHIHPAMQVQLGDLFIEQSNDQKFFLIETHSEHLLLRIMRRIRETAEEQSSNTPKISPNEVAIYYIESENGITQVNHIGLDENGRFTDRWPRGFFAERMHEILPSDIRERVEANRRRTK
jgi:predicted ATPase